MYFIILNTETLAVTDCETLIRDCEPLEETLAWECSQIKICCRAGDAGNENEERQEIKKKVYRNERRTKVNSSDDRNKKDLNIMPGKKHELCLAT